MVVGVRGGVGGVIGAQAAAKKKECFNYFILLLKATLVSSNFFFFCACKRVILFLDFLFLTCLVGLSWDTVP